MPEDKSIWVGRDEHHGVRAQQRKDLKPPPHWRLEAVAATPRPRSLTIGADRRHFAFIEDAETSDVWLLDTDGGTAQRLTTGRDPAPYWDDTEPRLSPDVSTVAYVDAGHVWLAPTSGGPARKLVQGGSPVWVDDARLVISVERDDTTRLAVADSADAWPRRLATEHGDLDDRGDEGEPAVSPDRTQVAYTFTPRGDLNRSEIRVADLATGAVRALTGTPRMHDHSPAWSPDGSAIAYTSERSGFNELHVVGRDGAGDRQLTAAAADHSEAEWHPDGSRLVAVRGRSNRFDLVSVDAESGSSEVLAEGGSWSNPHWTAAGAEVVAAYEDHATPPRLSLITPGAEAPRPARAGSQAGARGAPRCARGRELRVVRRARDPRLPDAPAGRLARPARAGGGLPARRSHRRLPRRLGRPRAVLRRQGLRLACRQLPRLYRLRPRLRARQSRRLGRGGHEGLPGRGRLPAHARLGRRRAPRDLRRKLRLVHGAAVGDRRPRAPLPLRGRQIRRLRHRHLVVPGRPPGAFRTSSG